MTFQQLRAFMAVAEEMNLSHAAKRMQLTPSTVSAHIRGLEQEFGLALFDVPSRYVRTLTEAGKELQRYAEAIISLSSEAEQRMKGFCESERPTWRIGTSRLPALTVVPHLIRQYHALHPDHHITVKTMTTPIVRQSLAAGLIDVGFIIDEKPVLPPYASLTVLVDDLICLYSEGTGLQWQTSPITAEQLTTLPLISHAESSSTAQMVSRWAESQGVRLTPLLTLDSLDMIKSVVKLGLGVAIVSKLAVLEEVERHELLYAPLISAPQRELKMIYTSSWDSDALNEWLSLSASYHVQPK